MNKTEMLNEKKLERLQDLVTSLENLGYYEEAEELQEYLLNPRATAGYIVEKFKGLFESITQDLDTDGLDCRRDEEGNQYEWDLKWIEKIMDVEIDYNWYKDVVKYDRCYLFFDNVLDRWMVRGEQRIWLSNIERDRWYNWVRPQEYIERWTWVKEKLTRMPRVQEFTLKEYQKLLEKWWIDIDWNEVINTTNTKVVTRNGKIVATKMNVCPDINMIMEMIGEESHYGEMKWLNDKYPEEQKVKSEEEKKLDEHNNELKELLMRQMKQERELKIISRQSC